jgi:tetratricopeptide (TPR) repeat protein
MALKAGSVSQVKAMRIGVSAVLACAGFLKDSAAVLSQSPGAPSPDLSPETKTLIGGCNAMNQGKAESGARELAASLDLDNDIYVEFFLGRAYMESRRPQQAIEIFKDLIASKGTIIASQSYPPVIWPLAHYQLAVTYDNASDTENAIRYYSKFLEIWSGADAMPEIVYAKNRLTTLRKGIHSGHNDPQRSR